MFRFLYAASSAKANYSFLFPGQGSQRVGMMEKLVHLSSVQRILSAAADVLGYDLQALCLRGPQSSLDKTVHCQPAVVVASLAAVEGLRETSPEVWVCTSTASVPYCMQTSNLASQTTFSA